MWSYSLRHRRSGVGSVAHSIGRLDCNLFTMATMINERVTSHFRTGMVQQETVDDMAQRFRHFDIALYVCQSAW